MIGHPSRRKLSEWLEGARDSELDGHLRSCERCAAALEDLETDAPVLALGDVLALVLAPPADLVERVEGGVAARLSSGQVYGVLSDLFGAGFETSRLLLTEEHSDDS